MLQWPWGVRWSLRGDSYSSDVNGTPGVYWVRTWGRAPARPVSHKHAESVLVTAFLQRHTMCAASGHLHLESRLWWVASQAFTAPGEQASLLKPCRSLGSVLRVRTPSRGPCAAFEDGPEPPVPPARPELVLGHVVPSLGWRLAVTPFPPHRGKPPGHRQ